MNELWEPEVFEDLVARGLIALYETNIKKHPYSHKVFNFTPELLNNIRNMGCYFAPNDRVCILDRDPETGTTYAVQELDVVNEGRPDKAIWCTDINPKDYSETDDMRKDSFLEISYLERVPKLPHPIKCDNFGRVYRYITVWARNDCLEGHVHHLVIDHTGKIHDTYWRRHNYNPISGRCVVETVNSKFCQSKEEGKRAKSLPTLYGHLTIQYWQDRRYLWNVVANEGIAKATLGVYPEQIKSLFYAREMPMTVTGRKRPILHWVASHQRRIKEGIDIDIEKHLRGINEFVYQGTKFVITRPIKGETNLNC